jgi:hypothetical protein
MVPDFLILSKVPDCEASAPVLAASVAGALLSLHALRLSASALAQNRAERLRCLVMYKLLLFAASIALFLSKTSELG